MQIAPSLHRIGNDLVAAYLVLDDDGVTVVDAGLAGHRRALVRELASVGRGLEDVRGVVLTHEGHQFVRHARTIMSAVADAAFAVGRSAVRREGHVEIGVTHIVAGYFLADPLAVGRLERIDYDFRGTFGSPQVVHAIRSRFTDELIRAFLARHPGATVACLGEGLETQLWCAASKMRRYDDSYTQGTKSPWNFRPGERAVTLDDITVWPANRATAILYTYTPWVLVGEGRNWAFWNILRQSNPLH